MPRRNANVSQPYDNSSTADSTDESNTPSEDERRTETDELESSDEELDYPIQETVSEAKGSYVSIFDVRAYVFKGQPSMG